MSHIWEGMFWNEVNHRRNGAAGGAALDEITRPAQTGFE
jgi:hypothetical protein